MKDVKPYFQPGPLSEVPVVPFFKKGTFLWYTHFVGSGWCKLTKQVRQKSQWFFDNTISSEWKCIYTKNRTAQNSSFPWRISLANWFAQIRLMISVGVEVFLIRLNLRNIRSEIWRQSLISLKKLLTKIFRSTNYTRARASWVKVCKNGLSKIYGRQPLKIGIGMVYLGSAM